MHIKTIMYNQLQGKMELGSLTVEVDGNVYPGPLCGRPTSLVFQLPLGVTLNDAVDVYRAVISQKQQLVNCMDCIKLSNEVCCACWLL